MTKPDAPAEVPQEIADHAECIASLKRGMAENGFEVNVSEWRAGMVMPPGCEPLDMVCPHGTRMWMEPTAEQRMRWTRGSADV